MEKGSLPLQIFLYTACCLLVVVFVHLYGVFSLLNRLLPTPVIAVVPIAAVLSVLVFLPRFLKTQAHEGKVSWPWVVAGVLLYNCAGDIPDGRYPVKEFMCSNTWHFPVWSVMRCPGDCRAARCCFFQCLPAWLLVSTMSCSRGYIHSEHTDCEIFQSMESRHLVGALSGMEGHCLLGIIRGCCPNISRNDGAQRFSILPGWS